MDGTCITQKIAGNKRKAAIFEMRKYAEVRREQQWKKRI